MNAVARVRMRTQIASPRRALLWLGLVLVAGLGTPVQAATLPDNVETVESLGGMTQYRLKSNGMTILLAPNAAAPVFSFLVVYHVGSRNEAPGNTGSAHLLEHLLFNKSTENFGKAKGHQTFQEVLYAAGADFGSTNMTTWNDRMTGYSTLPKDKLELAMRIEADRLGRGLILDSERQPEMSVVRNEYEIGENDPTQALWKAVVGAAIVAHPYHWDTIGYRSDIEGVSTEKLREHYDTFFHPDNAAAILVGDFDPAAALRLFDTQFGAFPRAKSKIPQIITAEPVQEGERRVVVKRPGQLKVVQMGYVRPGALHPDFIATDVLTSILSDGINSRLYRGLVETGLATEALAFNYTFRDPYPLMIQATVAPGHEHGEVEAAIAALLDKLQRDGVTADEMQRAKNQIEVAVIRSRDGTWPLCSSLAEAVASADWKWFVTYIDRMKAVTAADVRRVAATYLIPDRANIGWFVPVEAEVAAKLQAAGREMLTVPAAAASAGGGTTAVAAAPTSSPTATSSGSRFAERVSHRVAANEITVDVVENHAVPTVAIAGILLAGEVHTPDDKPGLAAITAMMVQRGTTKRDKQTIADQLAKAGANLSIDGGRFETTITGSGMSRDTGLLLDILSEELATPAWPDSEFAKAKAERTTDIQEADDNTGLRGIERLSQLVYPAGHPYRQDPAKTQLAALEATSLDDVRGFHKQRYVGSGLFLSVVGDVTPSEVLAQIETRFASLPKGQRAVEKVSRIAAKAPSRELVAMPGKANMNFFYGQASGLRRSDPDYEAALIANAALGQNSLSSRIGKRVRDTEGLSYSLSSRFNWTDELDGMWYVNVNVAPPNLEKAMASTLDEIRTYARDGITPEEVDIGKSFFAGNYQVRLGSNSGVARALVEAERFGYGPSYLDEYPARFQKVTKAEVDAALRKHLQPSKLHLVVAGDRASLP